MSEPIFQVSELVEAVNQHLNLLGEVTVEGEITRLDIKNGNLIFITVKDAVSSLDVFSMMHIVKNIRQFEPGMLVHITGTAGLYKGSGKFRLFAAGITPHGEGALQIAYEKLKQQLAAEGLFDPSHKRPLPAWPQRIGMITAKNSSAYYDQIKIISARMGGLILKVLPVAVQGREAIPTILNAIRYVNSHASSFDVLILARGGGSLEDLAAFNSEEVARTLFACQVPTISAIGHEDNWSLTDFVADARASTPSHAAEMVVKDRREVRQEILASYLNLRHTLTQAVALRQNEVTNAHHSIRHQVHQVSSRVNQIMGRLPALTFSFKQVVKRYTEAIDYSLPALSLRFHSMINLKYQEISHLQRLLASLDYRNVLKRGYSLTYTADGTIIKTAAEVNIGEPITTQLGKGSLISTVTSERDL